jgi:transposase-like protein
MVIAALFFCEFVKRRAVRIGTAEEIFMANDNEPHRQYEDSFKQAAIDFLNKSGSLETAASELGVDPAELQSWKKKNGANAKSAKCPSGMAQLRAENEALRNQILSLQIQWDILKATLGVLSTTVSSRELN